MELFNLAWPYVSPFLLAALLVAVVREFRRLWE